MASDSPYVACQASVDFLHANALGEFKKSGYNCSVKGLYANSRASKAPKSMSAS
jgi:hypothetical protein